ncbi:hypothetical protein C5167_017526, partial [Papaver somniferum]
PSVANVLAQLQFATADKNRRANQPCARNGIIEHGRKKEKSNAKELITCRKGIIEHGIKKEKYYAEVLRFERELYNKKLD